MGLCAGEAGGQTRGELICETGFVFSVSEALTRHPNILGADVGDSLVLVPVAVAGERLLDGIVEVGVVGENDVTSDVEEEALLGNVSRGKTSCLVRGVDQEPWLRSRRGSCASRVKLVKTLCGAETGRALELQRGDERTS